MSELAIQTKDISMSYGDHVALDQLTLNIEYGEVFGFLGHNGAGKTTTVNILTTLLKPTHGKAWVCGFDVVSDSLNARRQIGYVPENVHLYEAMTAQENLRFLGQLSGVEDLQKTIDETLELLDCKDLANRRVGTFSKGQRQRIGLAQAILHRPKVLFLDEPASGLDPMGMKMLRDLIVKLNAELKMTIFMNTHLIGEVAKTCTSIGVLNQGKLVHKDTLKNVMDRFGDDETLERLYLSLNTQKVA
ncbi:MAG: ABC transporter ATP-binding protein [Magnetovibrio sp.]|nr:ABC transporter ATP-binding protein [Magnetovibrio sp.]